jgi:PEP-CTERM motif
MTANIIENRRSGFLRSAQCLIVAIVLALSTRGQMRAGSFTSVPTSFGPTSALRDNSTGLQWLDLNLTANHSYNDVFANLPTGGIYAGWRFATESELATFFFNYSGGVVNDTIALNLMNDLGGPLFTTFNPLNGFRRQSSIALLDIPFDLGHALYGYIAVDNFSGPSIKSSLQGSAVDTFGFGSFGSWLVESSVPEPESWFLCILGFGALGCLKLRRRVRS